ncbi:MAG: 2-amino-4-hydroxy-6-hydroxymethyldihydropteridine diphosphokinase [Terricaulis sp.]
MTRAFVALGANMPFEGVQGAELLARATLALSEVGLAPLAFSGVWQTEAWPRDSGQPDYFNAVVEVDAGDRTPRELYEVLTGIERRFGRERRERWAPRTLDLDIIDLEGVTGDVDGIALPHPRMHERAFVLAPLAEIAPSWRHPESGLTPEAMLTGLVDVYAYRRIGDLSSAAKRG